jgi:hypothetical protein
MAARQTWTDDRMDDLVGRVDDGFAQTHGDLKDLRREVGSIREELRAENGSLRGELRAEVGSVTGELRAEIKSGDRELRTELEGLRSDMNQQFLALNRRFDLFQATLLAAVLAGLVGILASHLL